MSSHDNLAITVLNMQDRHDEPDVAPIRDICGKESKESKEHDDGQR